MPIDPIMPLVYVQDMGPTAKLAHDAAIRPEVAQAMARAMAEEMLREQAKQVEKSQDTEQSTVISDEEKGSGAHDPHFQGRRQRQKDEEDAPPQNLAPFVGKLINRKV